MDAPHLAQAEELRRLVREEVERQLADRLPGDRAALIVFSGDLDRVLAAYVIATGAAAAGLETTLFFTFWGLSVVKRPGAAAPGKELKQRLFAAMSPDGTEGLGTSRMNFFGLGARMLRQMMREQGIASLEELMAMAKELGVRSMACTMSMDAMGVRREELVDGLEYGGVGAFLAEASRARFTLFL